METTRIGGFTVSRLLLGTNPVSGFSHQGVERSKEMIRYFTTARIKEMLAEAEKHGITGVVARTDHHVRRYLLEYWDEGGGIGWLAQTATDAGPTAMCVDRAADAGAKACQIHGGVMDNLVAQREFDEIKRSVDKIRSRGLAAGVAGHNVRVFEWAEKNLEVDYYMCCHYNPSPRDDDPAYVPGRKENYLDEDRQAMVKVAATLRKPVIHFKILAAGRNEPEEAFAFCGKVMRPQDLVCVGIFLKDDPEMVRKNVELFEKHCAAK